MIRTHFTVAVFMLVCGIAGCGGGSSTPDFSSPDRATPDDLAAPVVDAALDFAMPPDLARPVLDFTMPSDLRADAARPVDLTADAAGGCQVDGDCQLFSSYCETAPCQCIPLRKADPDPPCNGRMVTCFAEPCMLKKAACVAGVCVAR